MQVLIIIGVVCALALAAAGVARNAPWPVLVAVVAIALIAAVTAGWRG